MAELLMGENFGKNYMFIFWVIIEAWYIYTRKYYGDKKKIYTYQHRKIFTKQAKNNKLMNICMYDHIYEKTIYLHTIKVWKQTQPETKSYFGKTYNLVLNVIESRIMAAV